MMVLTFTGGGDTSVGCGKTDDFPNFYLCSYFLSHYKVVVVSTVVRLLAKL